VEYLVENHGKNWQSLSLNTRPSTGLLKWEAEMWAGAVVHVVEEKGVCVCVLTSDEKWAKMKDILAKWMATVSEGTENLDHKQLLSDQGFLVYVTRAYPPMIPYMKGFHLTAEMWRGNRDAEGWKLPARQCDDPIPTTSSDSFREMDEDEAAAGHALRKSFGPVHPHAPSDGKTQAAPRLLEDLKALLLLTNSRSPPLRVVRPKRMVQVFYGFGDASGKGRGSTLQGFKTIQHPSGAVGPSDDILNKVGVWSTTIEEESSNYRELANLVEEGRSCTRRIG
jgi:hypothetical protein